MKHIFAIALFAIVGAQAATTSTTAEVWELQRDGVRVGELLPSLWHCEQAAKALSEAEKRSAVLRCVRPGWDVSVTYTPPVVVPPVVVPPPVVTPPVQTGSVTATRTSGTAPLAVQLEVTTGTFADAVTFDFGDSSGTWPISGQPKNTQTGARIASYVYERPGTYTARVAGQSITITVADPGFVYSGTKTVCVSSASNWTDCPAGAARATSIPALGGKRVLLRRGESFGAIRPGLTDAAFQIGAYGSGAKPLVDGVSTGMTSTVGSWTSDWTVMDLNIRGSVNIDATTTRFLLLRNDIKTPGAGDSMVNIGTAIPYYQPRAAAAVAALMPWPSEVFIVENDIQGVVNSTSKPNLVVMGFFYRSAILGNTIDKATEHSLRIWAASRTQISHNRVGGNHYVPGQPPGIRGAIKIHAAGTQPMGPRIAGGQAPASSRLVVSNNIIGSPTYPGSWMSGFSPQNADPGTVEGLEDCVAENNVFQRGPYTSSDMQLKGRRMTARGNTALTVDGQPSKANVSRSTATYAPGMAAWDGPYDIEN